AAHRVPRAVPGVAVADHPNGPGMRRPHDESGALDALVLLEMRTEDVPELLVTPLAPQEQIDLADRGHEAVGVVCHPVGPVWIAGQEARGLPGSGVAGLPQP